MNLNDRQIEIAIALREKVVHVPDDEITWPRFTDFTRAVARVIEGGERMVRPDDMQSRFQVAWAACAKMWIKENNRILRDCLGEDYQRVTDHPNAKNAMGRIMERVVETYGELTLGAKVKVDVEDILAEEIT